MARLIEKYSPYFITAVVSILYLCFTDIIFPLIQPNAEKITNITVTLASIFLGFVGVMYGILISFKDSSIISKLGKYRITTRIRYYIQESFWANWFAIMLSIFFVFTNDNNLDYSQYNVLFQIVVLLFICCSSFRMYRILYSFVKLIDSSYGESDIYTPSFK